VSATLTLVVVVVVLVLLIVISLFTSVVVTGGLGIVLVTFVTGALFAFDVLELVLVGAFPVTVESGDGILRHDTTFIRRFWPLRVSDRIRCLSPHHC